MTQSERAPSRVAAGWAGIAAVAFGAGLGELAAAIISPTASPTASIGSLMIDLAPPWAKDLAIALFGTLDKIALLTGIAVVLALVAAVAGLLEARRPPWGRVIVLALGAFGVLAAVTRANATGVSWLPSVISAVTAAVALGLIVRRLPLRTPASAAVSDTATDAPSIPGRDGADPDRRRFLVWSVGAAVIGGFAAVGSTVVRSGSRAATVVRDAIRLPAPATTAAPVPPGAELNIEGLAPVITPNDQFYRIDTALIVPQVDPAEWSLRIHGMVEEEITIGWGELLALPLEESVTTLTCVSNDVGGDLIGNALWLGYPIRLLLERARPTAGADMVLSRSIDGFTASSPIEALTDDRNAILAVGMNGDPLPAEHGFPVRMVVPGLYGYVSATKWVVEMEVTTFADATAYWTDRGWSELGPIKLQSRIDVPRSGSVLAAGDTVIAGVAWQQHVGISGVEVQIDGGDWQDATLATAISDDTWVQWSLPWAATSGEHTIRCRATNVDGETQTSDVQPVVPDGATGWDELSISVS
ncbi:molybdopterin-dependent oxidoreductase [Microbacterium sp.]|jgi:DMSO/TMAO reductase YedYZ molybdopterin-dependent catalytic subunit|uniref:molybdopterin-dependent oxidoreductase n=1 Tax=Microbacterium sp. TaxID=51671 RepID=UPI0037C6D82A